MKRKKKEEKYVRWCQKCKVSMKCSARCRASYISFAHILRRSEDMGFLSVENVARCHTIHCEEQVLLLSPAWPAVFNFHDCIWQRWEKKYQPGRDNPQPPPQLSLIKVCGPDDTTPGQEIESMERVVTLLNGLAFSLMTVPSVNSLLYSPYARLSAPYLNNRINVVIVCAM